MLVKIVSIIEFRIVTIIQFIIRSFFILCYCLKWNFRQLGNLIPMFTATENIMPQESILLMLHDEFIDAYHKLLPKMIKCDGFVKT